MKILIVGSGGREHALAWKIAQSPLVTQLFIAPGNGGTSRLATNVPIASVQQTELVDFARNNAIDLVVIGPDDALAAGLADALEDAGVKVFGPRAAAARVESSKAFAKRFMLDNGIPTARSGTFEDVKTAITFCDEIGYPVVIKADGLALGKGVIIAESHDEAQRSLTAMIEKREFGDAGRQVVVEEFLSGVECSVHALIDGKRSIMLEPARDHKQAYDGGKGPNTGGMGTISPVSTVTAAVRSAIESYVLAPFVRGLENEHIDFRGLLFPGLMLTPAGIRVLEFNARFGDPETQVLMRRFKSDLVPLLLAVADGTLDRLPPLEWDSRHAVCVVIASGGYPGSYEKGKVITGVDAAEEHAGVVVFHAGTRIDTAGDLVTSGGRVLGVTALGATADDARRAAYAAASKISFEGSFHRTDIGAEPTS